jgi:hypothetical protein
VAASVLIYGDDARSRIEASAMSLSLWFQSPRYLLTLFLAIMLALVG